MLVVPAEIPVTKPVLLTVALAVLELTHGLFVVGVPDPVNCVCAPTQTEVIPEIGNIVVTVPVTSAL